MTFKRCSYCNRKLTKPDNIHFRSHSATINLLNRGGFMECSNCDVLFTLGPDGKVKVVTMINLS